MKLSMIETVCVVSPAQPRDVRSSRDDDASSPQSSEAQKHAKSGLTGLAQDSLWGAHVARKGQTMKFGDSRILRRKAIVSAAALSGVFGMAVIACSSGAPLPTTNGGYSLQELSVATPSDLPSCKKKNEGEVAYISSTSALVACVSGTWVTITIPQGPTGPTGPTGGTGPTGPTGATGATSRLLITPVSPGTICAAGGEQIQIGIDTNNDGILELSEVQQTAYVCNGVSSVDAGAPDTGVTCNNATQFGPTQCDRCLAQSCCAQSLLCQQDTVCNQALACITACELTGLTAFACGGKCPAQANGPWGALMNCVGSSCGTCGVTTYNTCTNGIKDGTETGVDCGGGACPPCSTGVGCSTGSDCQSGVCSSSVCAAPLPSSCRAILAASPNSPSGVYPVDPDGTGPLAPVQVWCDMISDGGGWTLVLVGNSTLSPPTPNWIQAVSSDNVTGTFGTLGMFDQFLGAAYWDSLGTTMRLEAGASHASLSHVATYTFSLDEKSNYTIHLSNETIPVCATGTCSPGLFTYHNGLPLSTFDADHDTFSGNCSATNGNTAWWYGSCWAGSFWGSGGAPGAGDAPYWSANSGSADQFAWAAIWIR